MEKISKGRIPLFTILKVLIASYLITVVFLLILAALMYKMELGESIVDGGIVITYILSCFLCCSFLYLHRIRLSQYK